MMKEEIFEKAFDTLKQEKFEPTKMQKEFMLNQIKLKCQKETLPVQPTWKKWLSNYPWRVAFIVSAVQTVLFTIILGTNYTNLLFGILGG